MVERLSNLSRLLGRKTVYSAIDVAKAMYSVASAGYDVGEVTERDLIPILNYAAATQTDLAYATESVIKTAKQFGLELSDTSRIVDVFTGAITSSFETAERLAEGLKYTGQIAGALGISLEDTVAALSTLVNKGYEGAQAGQRLNMALTKLLKPSNESEKILSKLGLTIADVDPHVHSLTEILYKLKAAGFGAADAATMFRARTAAAIVTLVKSADEIEKFSKQLELTQGLTDELAKKQLQTLWGSIQQLKNAITDFYIGLSDLLAPAIGGVGDYIRHYLLPGVKALISPLLALGKIFQSLGATGDILKNVLLSIAVATGSLTIAIRLLGLVLGKEAAKGFYLALLGSQSLLGGWRMLLAMAIPLGVAITAIGAGSKSMGAKLAIAATTAIELVYAVHLLRKALEATKLSLAGILGPIGILMIALSSLYMILQDQINSMLGSFAEGLGIIPSKVDKVRSAISKALPDFQELRTEMERMVEAQRNLANAQEEYNKAMLEGKVTPEIIKNLREAIAESESTEKDFLGRTSKIIKILGQATEGVSKYLTKYEKKKDLEEDLASLGEDQTRIDIERTKAQNDYNNAVLLYGSASEEAKNALSKLTSKQIEYDSISDQIEIKTDELKRVKGEMAEVDKKLTDVERDLIGVGT